LGGCTDGAHIAMADAGHAQLRQLVSADKSRDGRAYTRSVVWYFRHRAADCLAGVKIPFGRW
jgi:hypothetical protein